jgi:hypothetical protein
MMGASVTSTAAVENLRQSRHLLRQASGPVIIIYIYTTCARGAHGTLISGEFLPGSAAQGGWSSAGFTLLPSFVPTIAQLRTFRK